MADVKLSNEHITSESYRNYEAARNSFFEFIVPEDKIASLLKPASKAGDDTVDTIGDLGADCFRYNVVKCDVPTFDLALLEYRRGNDVVKFAGVPTYKEGSLTIDDVVGMHTKSILLAWKQAAFNPHTRKGGRMADYKFDCTLQEYTQDYELIREWILYGCWVSSTSESAFDRESDAKRQITATLQYDRAEVVEETKEVWE